MPNLVANIFLKNFYDLANFLVFLFMWIMPSIVLNLCKKNYVIVSLFLCTFWAVSIMNIIFFCFFPSVS